MESELAASRWFDEELPALRAAVALGHERGHHRQSAYLARNTMFQLHQRGDVKRLRETGELSVAAAREARDPHTLRLNLINLPTGPAISPSPTPSWPISAGVRAAANRLRRWWRAPWNWWRRWAHGPGSARSRTSPGSSTGGAKSTCAPSICTGAPSATPRASSSASRSPARSTAMAQPSHALGDYVAAAEHRRLADGHFDAMSVPQDSRRRS
ncbi:hypothetical protein [Streptomyces sp. NPDC048361]|uniref:hypothetical protein n=1 Tax=Streptomyces sp. NPDC048361 TaxID=3154720 RepID=UPI00342ED146